MKMAALTKNAISVMGRFRAKRTKIWDGVFLLRSDVFQSFDLRIQS